MGTAVQRAQPRGSGVSRCHSSGRQARRTAFRSCTAGSTSGASTRTTTTRGPGAVAPALVHQIGRKAAFELLTLCENVNAERALALGMINRVVPRDDLLSEARRMSEQLAGFNHDALWMTKRTIQRAASMSSYFHAT